MVGIIFNPNLEAIVARGAVESNSGFLSSSWVFSELPKRYILDGLLRKHFKVSSLHDSKG